jgi:hypothetical protein
MRSRLPIFFALAVLLTASALQPSRASAQLTPSDSAAVILQTARDFEAAGRWDVAEALYRLVVDRYGGTPAAVDALPPKPWSTVTGGPS